MLPHIASICALMPRLYDLKPRVFTRASLGLHPHSIHSRVFTSDRYLRIVVFPLSSSSRLPLFLSNVVVTEPASTPLSTIYNCLCYQILITFAMPAGWGAEEERMVSQLIDSPFQD
jgi:hypothetical protein